MFHRKQFFYLSFLCFLFLFLAISYRHSDTTLKRMEQEVLSASQFGVYKGDLALDFKLVNGNGETKSLSDYKGKKVVLNFFATWCGPCQEEMPTFVELDKKINNDQFVFLGVNLTKEERNANQVRNFLKHYQVKYEVLYDGDGKVMKDYQLIGIPTTLFLDENGKIVERFNGIITMELVYEHPFFKGVLK